MLAAIARALVALLAGALIVVAVWGVVTAYGLLTLEGDEGGATVFGSVMLPSAIAIGLIGLGMFRARYAPVNFGSRFSRKAATPSLKSAVWVAAV